MANDDHIAQLMKGVDAWNEWRKQNPDIRPDLREAYISTADLRADLTGADFGRADLGAARLRGAELRGADFAMANLRAADLSGAQLFEANLGAANLRLADLSGAELGRANLLRAELGFANLRGADLSGAYLVDADLAAADLSGANLTEANLSGGANLVGANLTEATLSEAKLDGANLSGANLTEANLSGANLVNVTLVGTDLTGADLTGCRVFGISAWRLKLERAKQQNLIITQKSIWPNEPDEPQITVDNIEIAQFIYLMLNNQKIRDVIDTITSKVVLILGRFTDERKAVLNALRDELRKRDYLPILFDFAVPATRDITETVSLLARMARFIIADLTDPSSIPKELEAIVPDLAVPVQPLLEGSARPYAMFKDYWKYDWVLREYRYKDVKSLLATLAKKVIAPAERKAKALQKRRRVFEAELTKPR
jgi:uncharacterized protein YjbI with pentapeptide repeats